MANQKLPIIDWTSGKIKELPSVEEILTYGPTCNYIEPKQNTKSSKKN